MKAARARFWSLATLILAVSGLLAAKRTSAAERDLPPLRVSENHRFLVTGDGRPFYWLADTAWWIRQLPPPLVKHYLSTPPSRVST